MKSYKDFSILTYSPDMSLRFEQIDHTADIGIIAYGRNIKELFENAAFGMFSVLTDISRIKSAKKLMVTASGVDYENLLVNWLNELVYLTKTMLFSEFNVKEIRSGKDRYILNAEVKGAKIDPAQNKLNFEIKSATYSNLKIAKRAKGYRAKIIFDI